jgi:hypothetical protein
MRSLYEASCFSRLIVMLKKFLIFLLILSPSIFYLWFVQQGTKQDPVAQEIHSSAENNPSYPTPDH